jgi:hypothetical protein
MSYVSTKGTNPKAIKALVTRIMNKGKDREIMVVGGNLYLYRAESEQWFLSQAIGVEQKATRSYVEREMKSKGYYL